MGRHQALELAMALDRDCARRFCCLLVHELESHRGSIRLLANAKTAVHDGGVMAVGWNS